MPLTVNLEAPPGTLAPSRQFNPGERIRVSGKVTSSFGAPNSFQKVRLDIHPSTGSGQVDGFAPIYAESSTNILGNYWFDVTLPDVTTPTRATLAVTAWFIWPQPAEQGVVPISIGDVAPDPLPTPGGGDLIGNLVSLGVLMVFVSLMGSVMPMMQSILPARRSR